MKKSLTILIVLLSSFVIVAQTVVRMRMPVQSEKTLSVATLYNEALPTGVSIVLGIIGYEIKGGSAPYQYEWLKNNQVIATGEVVVITPEKGNNYVLRVKDKNGCFIENAINVSGVSKVAANYLSETVEIRIQHYSHELNVEFKGFVPENTTLRIFDLQGKLHLQKALNGNSTFSLSLPAGIYLAVVGNGQLYHVQKFMQTN